jgi:hypothetical protein
MHLEVKQVLARFERAEARKMQWSNILEQCYEFALPQRNLYGGHWEGRAPGQSKMDRVFDSTAINSTQRFANRIQATMFPPYRHWCRLVPGDDIPAEVREKVEVALDLYNERMFAVLRQTNFDLAMSEFLLDLCVGTAVMMVMPGDETTPVRFEAVPQYLVSFEEGPHGTIDNVYRKMRLKAEAIQQQWPDAKLPDKLQQMVDDKPHEDVDLLEATIYSVKDDYWCYHVIVPDMREELVFRMLDSSMWVISRWMVCSGEIWGRGPLCTALPDILTLNATKRMLLQNASLSIAGMYTASDDGVLNPQNINIEPGAVIPVARNGGPQGPSLVPLARAGDFNLAQIVINDLSMSIKKTLLDDTLPPDTMSARSATEVGARMSELANNMGASFGRLITEAMLPLVKRILHVMEQENLIDMAGMRVDGRTVKVVPVSPLAKAQNSEELESVLQFAQIAESFGPMGQMAINQERALEFVADRLGVPARVLTTEDERATMMAQMQEAMEGAAEAQQEEGAPAE